MNNVGLQTIIALVCRGHADETIPQAGENASDIHCIMHMQVCENEVNRLHKAFYAKVGELFEQHKGSFKGYENVKLVMIE